MISPPLQKIVLGTRGSELALTQARMAQQALEAAWPGLIVEQQIIKTTGDLRPDLKLSEFNRGPMPADKGVFTKELEEALREGRIHVAVHSLKDVPTILEDGFAIAAVLPRAPIEDVLVTRKPATLESLPHGALIATSSVRRSRQARLLRPDLRVEDIRGNVPTRLRKLSANDSLSGIILARAGLQRLGLYTEALAFEGTTLYQHTLDAHTFLPAASQGAVAFETFRATPELTAALAAICHAETFACITAERRFLELLQAGCQTPVGLLSERVGTDLRMTTVVFSESDPAAPPKRAAATGSVSDPARVAGALMDALAQS